MNKYIVYNVTFLTIFISIILNCCGAKVSFPNYNVGGLFETDETDEHELAFRLATKIIKKDKDILPDHSLSPLIIRVPKDNSLIVSKSVNDLRSSNVVGIFGPSADESSDYVQSICDTLEIPHIITRRDSQLSRGISINIHPYPPVLAKVYADIVKAWKWTSFTIFYENPFGLQRINELLKIYVSKEYPVTLRRLEAVDDQNYRPVFQAAKKSGEKHFVLECSIENLYTILSQAQQVGIMTEHYHFVITSLDMHTIDLEPFQYAGSNITGVRLVNQDRATSEYKLWEETVLRSELESNEALQPHKLSVDTALMYDGMFLFAKSLTTNDEAKGFTLINDMKMKTHDGLTGLVRFDSQGYRSDFVLDVMELTHKGFNSIGVWNSTDGLRINRMPDEPLPDTDHSLQNRTFRVLISINKPYQMLKRSTTKLTGNDKYEGFGIDLIAELSKMLGFKYIFIEESAYGKEVNALTNAWDGMIGQIRNGTADLAITDLTITSEREKAADFTMPFMNLGISILFKTPSEAPPHMLSFLDPFSVGVWKYLGVAFVGVSLMLFFLGRISAYEWTNPYACIEEPEFLLNQFSLKNSFWFTMGSLMQQGTEIAPIATSTRLVAGIWWLFVLIMVSSYTANLAAFLTTKNPLTYFNNAEELASNTHGIKYGAKGEGSTNTFFKTSNVSAYKKMGEFMANNPDVYTQTNDEGLKRVKDEEKYAFLMESTSIEYATERDCSLKQFGGKLDDKGYGIAMKKNSSFRDELSTAVLTLQESGFLTKLKTKWWKEKYSEKICDDEDESSNKLTLENLGGVFLVLIVGTVAALVFSFFEMVVYLFHLSVKNKIPFMEVLKEELLFVIKCSGETKPVRAKSQDALENVENESHKSEQVVSDLLQTPFGFIPELRTESPDTK